MSRVTAFWACLGVFVALSVAAVVDPFIGNLDESVANIHPKATWPQFVVLVRDYELLGQRGPTLLVFAPLVVWLAWRRRDRRPVVALVSAEILLNVGVGIVKYSLGRVGPFYSENAHAFFDGGDIFPSGHVSNAVVLYGLVAWTLAPRWRRWAGSAAVFLSVTVGLGTLFLRTHWFSDVVGGLLAGALVLLALPTVMPAAERWTDVVLARVPRRRPRRFGAPPASPVPPSGAGEALPANEPALTEQRAGGTRVSRSGLAQLSRHVSTR